MSKITFAKVLSLPAQKSPNTIYIVQGRGNLADIVVTGTDAAVVKTVKGFSEEMVIALALSAPLSGMTEVLGSVSVTDTVISAIGKLQAQATLFGQGVEGQAIFSATQFESVPTEFKAQYVVVTQPHIRMMSWDGSKYIRAPWNQPGMVLYSYDNPASIPGYLPVRGDVTYNQANYPDLVARLGLSGTGTFTLVEARGEALRVLDNGRGVDAGRGLRTAQGDAVRPSSGISFLQVYSSGPSLVESGGITGPFYTDVYRDAYVNLTTVPGIVAPGSMYPGIIKYDIARSMPTANEIRMRNVAFPAWVSY